MAPKLKMWIPVIMAIFWSCYLNEWSREIVYKLIQGDTGGAYQLYLGDKDIQTSDVEVQKSIEKLFTSEELSKFNNIETGLYLSILGQVFDVSIGEKHYSKGSAYHALTARDASKAFITGDFSAAGLTDDVSTLKNSEVKSLNEWLTTYHGKYVYKGKLIGRFYDENGSPKKDLLKFHENLRQAEKEKTEEDSVKRKFPPCNVEWSEESGTKVWCTSQSGGITRDWVGVPREFLENPVTQQKRCACVNLNSPEYLESKANFREYDNCAADAITCSVKSS